MLENIQFPLMRKLQIILISIIVIITMGNFLSSLIVQRANNNVIFDSLSASLDFYSQQLSEQLHFIEAISDSIFTNRMVQDDLFALQDSRDITQLSALRSSLYWTLHDQLLSFRNDHINSVSFFQDGNRVAQVTQNARIAVPETITDSLYVAAIEGQGRSIWITDYAMDYGFFLVRQVRQIEHLTIAPLGVMIIHVDSNRLFNATGGNHFFLYDGNDYEMIFRNSESEYVHLGDMIHPNGNSRAIISVDGTDYFATAIYMQSFGWFFIQALPYDEIVSSINLAHGIRLLVTILVLVVALIISRHFILSTRKRFKLLLVKMGDFGAGELQNNTIPLSSVNDEELVFSQEDRSLERVEKVDELSLIHESFDNMTERINTLIAENYVTELSKKEAQLSALERQINPHFLYNTLDSIHWRAKIVGDEDISQITHSLGNLLRATLTDSNDAYTLKHELGMMYDYISIQKFRYKERLVFIDEIDESLYGYDVPKLIIQPHVENAIHYGLEEMIDACVIRLSSFEEDDRLKIEISNSGSSFPEELVCGNTCPKTKGFGIGITNTDQRIKMQYGNKFGLTFRNEYDETEDIHFAIVSILLPKIPNYIRR